MKKILLVIAIFAISTAAFSKRNTNNNSVIGMESSVSITNVDATNGVIDILVKANAAADDLCNYFNGSWVDTGLTLYCTFGGDLYTCTAYKVVQAACTINGAVRLSIQGDYNAAMKKALGGAAKVYTVSKVGQRFYIK